MNKVHCLTEEMPCVELEEVKEVKYLYVEADEDHIAEQHGNKPVDNTGVISKLMKASGMCPDIQTGKN